MLGVRRGSRTSSRGRATVPASAFVGFSAIRSSGAPNDGSGEKLGCIRARSFSWWRSGPASMLVELPPRREACTLPTATSPRGNWTQPKRCSSVIVCCGQSHTVAMQTLPGRRIDLTDSSHTTRANGLAFGFVRRVSLIRHTGIWVRLSGFPDRPIWHLGSFARFPRRPIWHLGSFARFRVLAESGLQLATCKAIRRPLGSFGAFRAGPDTGRSAPASFDDRVRASRDRLADSACYSRALNPLGRLWVRFAKLSHPTRAAVGFVF